MESGHHSYFKNRIQHQCIWSEHRYRQLCGDWHIGLGRPADGAFGFSKLALRFELAADCAELIDGHILAAGAFRAARG